MDPEAGQQQQQMENVFSDKSIRQGFIRKVLLILSLQLIITFIPLLCITYITAFQEILFKNLWILLAAVIAGMVIVIPLACIKTLRTSVPINYILLFGFTISESITIGYIGAVYRPEDVSTAILITSLIILGLTLFALQTKYDFTMLNGVMFCILLCFVVTGIIFGSLIVSQHASSAIRVIYSGLGALIFSIFFVIDLQMIIGGYRSVVFSPEEYVFACLTLYLDMMRIFLYILQIVGELKR